MTEEIQVQRVLCVHQVCDEEPDDILLKEEDNTVSDLRKNLRKMGVMDSSDVFLLPNQQFALAKIDEDTTEWSILKNSDNVSKTS
jgi:hypothetical protein